MDITIDITGTSPLLMHNPRMVDPDYPINRELSAITSKRKKTDADRARMELLEWHGGLYTEGTNPVRVVQPTSKVRKCLIEAGRISKQGKQVERAVSFSAVNVELRHDGPDDPDAIYADERFVSRLSVGVNGKRVMRTRPQFEEWGLTLEGLLIEDAGLNVDELERLIKLGGVAIGIGDNRVNGYGRFTGTLEVNA